MEQYVIKGGNPLYGEVEIGGAKNAALPILAAAVLVGGVCQIHNCPELTDTKAAIDILRHLGCKVKTGNNLGYIVRKSD